MAAGERADTVFLNGRVLTMDPRRPEAEAVAVGGDRILAVGSSGEVRGLAGPAAEVIDLRGRLLLPGFVDSHCHLSRYGLTQLGLDCKARSVTSIADLQRELARVAETIPAGSWIRARGYDHSRLAEGRHPTRWDLDAVTPDHPVHLVRTCGHIGVANTRALELAGIRDDTPDPPGGHFERREGRLTGLMYESAQGPLYEAGRATREELGRALEIVERDWLRAGITSAVDCGGSDGHFQAWQDRRLAGRQRLRVTLTVIIGSGRRQGEIFVQTELATGFGDDWLRLGPFKVIVDGSSSGPTAGTRQPYASQPDFSGHINLSQEELDRLFGAAHRAGYQLTMHAVGDWAIEMGLDAMEKAFRADGPPRLGARIEHCAMAPADLRARIKQLGVTPVAQPYFLWEFGDGYIRNYGPERGGSMFPLRSFLAAGIPVAGSSDSPVSAHEPLRAIQIAATRQTMDGQVAAPEERIEVADALRLYTLHGARAMGEDGRRGSVEAGKLADLIVLGADPTRTPIGEIAQIPIELTMVGGEVAFSA
jgi:predicted amidohydrolase YtcJ